MVAYNHPGTVSESPIMVGDRLGFYYKGGHRTAKVVQIGATFLRCEDLIKGGFRCFSISEMRETYKIVS